jgi:uncharacterized membrane protein YpjA
MKIAAALGVAFVTTLAAYSLLMVAGAYVFPERSSFSVLFWYMGVLSPIACLYLAVQVLRLFKFTAELGRMIAFAIVGFVALSLVNILMGSVNASSGSELAWRYVAMLAVVHLITFVCPILILGKRLLGE